MRRWLRGVLWNRKNILARCFKDWTLLYTTYIKLKYIKLPKHILTKNTVKFILFTQLFTFTVSSSQFPLSIA